MPARHPQSPREEIANSISHGVGFIGALIALPLLVQTAARSNDFFATVGALVFGLTILLLYGSSTIYHALPATAVKAKEFFHLLDHASIYLLIAGSYTPFAMGVLRGSLGWTLFNVVWGMAILGVILKCCGLLWLPWLSTLIYLLMGWLVLFTIVPVVQGLPVAASVLLFAGGFAYSGGVAFYHARRPFFHLVWHLWVMAGTACHVGAVLLMQTAPAK